MSRDYAAIVATNAFNETRKLLVSLDGLLNLANIAHRHPGDLCANHTNQMQTIGAALVS